MEKNIHKPYLWRNCLPTMLLLVAMCFSEKSVAQKDTIIIQTQSSIKGRLFDSTQKNNCALVVVALLQKDSSLLSFTRSQKDGSFYLDHLRPGRFVILFTHPGYNEYSFPIILKDGENKDLGNMTLPLKSDLLTAVTVTPTTVNPHFRGDTLEYNVGHLQMKPNATVEEMLKRLPGVQVDRFGKITVNGQLIERLLVDGEDLFSGDPKIVTRNFNADMINKVQVLDKKSKEAEFTGIDDGQKTKTLNLTLKEDSKRGYFGKAEAGGDLQDHYSTNGLLGSFKDRRQFVALVMDANTGSLGFGDNSGVTSVGISIRASAADPLSASAGWGIPHNVGSATHYANHWIKYDGHLSGDIQVGRLRTAPFSSNTTIQTLPDGLYAQQKHSVSHNTQDQQGISAQYEFRPDSLNALELSFAGSSAQSDNTFNGSDSSSLNDALVNSSLRQINSRVRSDAFNASLMWRIRGRKRRQSGLSLVANIASKDNTTDGMLHSINNFYLPDGSLNYRDSIDQRKFISSHSLVLNSTIGYSEPLSKFLRMSITYGLSLSKSQSLLSTYGKGAGNYDAYIDSLSNHYENTILSQSIGLGLAGNIKKLGYSVGAGISHYSNTQDDLLKSSRISYPYTNITPSLNLTYRINASQDLTFDYRGQTDQPSITQLQPVQNNSDPLHVTIGNPNLHSSFSHSFGADYRKTGMNMVSGGLRFNFVNNAFGARIITDSLGRQTSQTVNVNGNRGAGVFMYIGNRMKKVALDYSLSPFAYYTHNVNYVGPLLDYSDGLKTGIDVGLNKYVNDKYSIGVHCQPIWYAYSSAINPDQRVQYWTFNANIGASLFFLKGSEFNMTGDYSWQQKVSSLNKATSVLLWNAFIGRNFLKNQLSIRWQVNDILGQNKGISRSINSTTITENTYNVLGRYWLLTASFRWMHHRAVK